MTSERDPRLQAIEHAFFTEGMDAADWDARSLDGHLTAMEWWIALESPD